MLKQLWDIKEKIYKLKNNFLFHKDNKTLIGPEMTSILNSYLKIKRDKLWKLFHVLIRLNLLNFKKWESK